MNNYNQAEKNVLVYFTKDELSMLRAATGGAAFKGTTYRKIPVLPDWTKDEALQFEAKIRQTRDRLTLDDMEVKFSNREIAYLTKIHAQNMQELDPREYQTITGYSWDEATSLLQKLDNLIHNLNE